MADIINITKCDIIEIISEGHRFLIHVIFVSIFTNLIDGTVSEMFNKTLLKTLLATALSVIVYHILLKRVIEPKLKKLKKICEE
jgi:hypothetical protein